MEEVVDVFIDFVNFERYVCVVFFMLGGVVNDVVMKFVR